MTAGHPQALERHLKLRRVIRRLALRKVAFLTLALAASFGLSALRGGPISPPASFVDPEGAFGPTALSNAQAYLSSMGLTVGAAKLLPAEHGPFGLGLPARLVASASLPGHLAELVVLPLRLSEGGIPVAVGQVVWLTRSPEGDERLLAADEHRTVASLAVGGALKRVLVFDERAGRPGNSWLWHLLDTRQQGGHALGRTDLILNRPVERLEAGLSKDGLWLSLDGQRVEVDLRRGTVQPPDALTYLPPARGPWPSLGEAIAHELTDAGLLEPRVLFELNRFIQTLPTRPAMGRRLAKTRPPKDQPSASSWPPKALDWTLPPGFEQEPDPPARMVHLDGDVWVFAFDLERLGLEYVPGTELPRAVDGQRAGGDVARALVERRVAAFSGGAGPGGAVLDGQTLVAPTPGLGTISLTDDGRVGLGVWDAQALPAPWTSLRQSLAPLVLDGVVMPKAVRRYLAPEDAPAHRPARRLGMGMTGDGLLLVAYAEDVTAQGLGEALTRAGARFAVHLAAGSRARFLLYAQSQARRPVLRLPNDARSWPRPSAEEHFVLGRRDAMPRRLALPGLTAPDEGRWWVLPTTDAHPAVAKTYLSAERIGGRLGARLFLMDTGRLRLHLVPGMGEPWVGAERPLTELALDSAPTMWLPLGLHMTPSPYGLVAGGRTFRPPQAGLPSLAVGEDGRARFGVYGEGELALDRPWSMVLQGPHLLSAGRPTPQAQGRAAGPLAALGRLNGGELIYASVPDGDREALAEALRIAGAREAFLTGTRSTVEVASPQFLRLGDEGVESALGPQGVFAPARLSAEVGSVLIATRRAEGARGRVLGTFRGR